MLIYRNAEKVRGQRKFGNPGYSLRFCSHYQKFKTTHKNNKIVWYCIILHHLKFEIASYLLF